MSTSANQAGSNTGVARGCFFDVIHREQPIKTPSSHVTSGPLAKAHPPSHLAQTLVTRIIERSEDLNRAMAAAVHGAPMPPQQLLALQMKVQHYSMEVETVTRVVDRMTSAVKQTLNTQI